MAITIEDITKAADKIAADGGNPTLAAVRAAVGGGSYTTINEAMKAWKAKQQAKVAISQIREAAPAAVIQKLNELGAEIWSTALELANTRLHAEREALEHVRQDTEEAQKQAADIADQLNVELEQAIAIIEQKNNESLQLKAELDSKSCKISELEAALSLAKIKAETSAQAASDSHAVQAAEIVRLRALIDDHTSKMIGLSNNVAVFKSKLETSDSVISKLETELENIKKQNNQLSKELTSAHSQIQSQQTALDTAAIEIDAAKKQRIEAIAEAKKSVEEAAELRGKLSALLNTVTTATESKTKAKAKSVATKAAGE
jgi:chromosome segregation ATPase